MNNQSVVAAGASRNVIPNWLRNGWGQLAGLLMIVVVAFCLWTAAGFGDQELNGLISNIAFMPISLFAALACFRIAIDKNQHIQLRLTWLFLGLAICSYFIGDVIWFVMESVLMLPVADAPYTVADIFYLMFFPLTLIGLKFVPVAPMVRSERFRFVIDLLTVMTAAWMLVWYFIISPKTAEIDDGLALFVAGIYPLGDLIMTGSIVSLLFRRPDSSARASLLIFSLGLACFVVTDWLYAYMLLEGTYVSGGLIDNGWLVSYMLLAFAAIRQQALTKDESYQTTQSPFVINLTLLLPFAAIAIGYGLILLVTSNQWLADFRVQLVMLSGALLTVLIISRQTLALRENKRLNVELKKQFDLLQIERDKSEQLLLNILPEPIAARLKQNPTTIADSFPDVTVLFADLVGFTQLASKYSPQQLVRMLNELFSAYDALADKHGLEKIKTIGDAYMAVSGLPNPNPNHAQACAHMAIEMHAVLQALSKKWGVPLHIRVGLNTGPVVAGVIGQKKFIYDLWGDTVNIASRMESHGEIGRTHVSESTYHALKEHFILEKRGSIRVKGKGEMLTYFLSGSRTQDVSLRHSA